MRYLILTLILMLMGCDKPKEIVDCIDVYYVELNSGTYSIIVTESCYGAREQMFFGKYICNKNGTITLTSGGNIRRRYGLVWHTVKIDPNMPQLSRYMHPNCGLCAKP